ncbi:coiled-coil domain-containing protein 174 [Nasonia vitripennis]|uniref:CCDC174 alpha/beta GRSR domain-containing protein n=1 Tax=Nasonia vitripennis TaxID=7425 RepID=A0A7M7LKE2_NASVI|nr:coiled-coil domain-containing protein 174 [Nasonia vitripennis]
MNAESKINIHHSSLVGLKAELLRKKAEVEAAKAKFENVGPVNRSKPNERKTQEKQNKKQTEKDGKNNLSEDVEDVKALKKSKLMLQAKSRLYEKLAKSHNNMNPNFLVDFEHKPDSSDHSEEENSKNNGVNENESDYDSDDGWVEYTDCFGRTRKCLREDLPKMQEKDDYLMKTVVEKEQHKEKKEKPLFFEDRLPEKEPEIEMMRRKWEEETAKLANKVDIHYQDVLFDEARTHGVGYYAFSQDEEERAKQQENLMKLRKETEQKQKENQEIRDMKERMQQNRLRVARLRQRIRAGLPAEESEEETVETSSTDPLRVKDEEKQDTKQENEEKEKTESDTNQSKSSSDEKQASTKRKHEDVENKIEAFGKILGKSNEWYVMSQEEWTMKKRKERIQEFAPVYNNFQRGESFDLKNCDANKNQDLPKSNQDESSNDSDIIGPLPAPNYAPELKEQIPLPPANDVSQISGDSTDHASVNIADQIAAGLKYLRKQFESKHHQ